MKIAIDIGGVISKYPEIFQEIVEALRVRTAMCEVHVITDMHSVEESVALLRRNSLCFYPQRVHAADYERYGETAASNVSADQAVNNLNLRSPSRSERIEVHRCRATLPVPVVETVEMEAERVES